MGKYILLLLLLVVACKEEQNQVTPQTVVEQPKRELVEITTTIKNTKEISKQVTDYEYQYDWLNGKFRQQPNVHTETKYFLIYANGVIDEVPQDKYLFYQKGDTIKYTQYKE